MKRIGRVSLVMAVVVLLAACEREQRTLIQPPDSAKAGASVRMNDLVSGAPPVAANPYERNAQGLADGKRLFDWFNCSGCHAQGGGDKGPALIDDDWIYGSEPANIVASILEGRPNGMPSFAGRIDEAQAWQLAAYVRSLAGLVPKDAAPGRNDALVGHPAENRLDATRALTSNKPEK